MQCLSLRYRARGLMGWYVECYALTTCTPFPKGQHTSSFRDRARQQSRNLDWAPSFEAHTAANTSQPHISASAPVSTLSPHRNHILLIQSFLYILVLDQASLIQSWPFSENRHTPHVHYLSAAATRDETVAEQWRSSACAACQTKGRVVDAPFFYQLRHHPIQMNLFFKGACMNCGYESFPHGTVPR